MTVSVIDCPELRFTVEAPELVVFEISGSVAKQFFSEYFSFNPVVVALETVPESEVIIHPCIQSITDILLIYL